MSYKGLQQYCYYKGFDHAQPALPDPIGEAIEIFACTLVPAANKAYGQGIVDGYKVQYGGSAPGPPPSK